MEVWLVYKRCDMERMDWFDWVYMATDISDILDRRRKGVMTGREKREEESWGEGGGERNPALREREKDREMDGRTKIALCGHAVHFHFPCPNIQFTAPPPPDTHAGTYWHILTHLPVMSHTYSILAQITLTHTSMHKCTYKSTHTHTHTHTHTISFTIVIKLVHSHILLHLHTRSFSQSCSHIHPVYFQQMVSCT